ncbi:uncharacterized protein LOC135303832 isoform X1 [Passer domesticus]|uniref:uncharacterized protein LOC135303832 isoform X1 n=1 Tax=Passer domesticus TaxID=48849 RepID=UPI0030FDF706
MNLALTQASLLDRRLQNVITPLCGPVWVFERGGFSPSGAEIYIRGVLLALHQRVKPAKCCKQLCHRLEMLQCLLGEGNACPVIAEPTINRGVNCASLVVWDVVGCIFAEPGCSLCGNSLKPSVLTAVLHRQLSVVSKVFLLN